MDMEYQWEGISCPCEEISDTELDFSQIKKKTKSLPASSAFEESLLQFDNLSLNISHIYFGIGIDSNSHVIKHKKIELKLIVNDKKKTVQVLKSISPKDEKTITENEMVKIYVTKINPITDSWIIVVTSNELNICSMIIIWKVSSETKQENKTHL